MNKSFSLVAGVALIAVGVLALMLGSVLPMLGIDLWRLAWRFWPLIVVGVGAAVALPPVLVRGQRALGVFFILAALILATGAILLWASLLDYWHIWAWLWPLEVLAVAAGFLLAAVYARSIWLLIPAIIIGANGLLFQFCAVTGWWQVWAVMWAIEPLSVGAALLLVGARRRSNGLVWAGLILCGVAGLGLLITTSLLVLGWWPMKFMGPLILIFVGALLLLWTIMRHPAPIAEQDVSSVSLGQAAIQ